MLDKPLHNTLMMSSNQNMHCLSPRTQVQWSTHTSTYTVHTHTCSWACNACTHKHTLTVTFLQIHTQTHPLPYTQTHQQCVKNFWHCCLWAPLFSGKGLAFHKHPSVCLYKLLGCASIPGHWCLKAHFVSQCVQVSLPMLLTRVVRNWSVER